MNVASRDRDFRLSLKRAVFASFWSLALLLLLGTNPLAVAQEQMNPSTVDERHICLSRMSGDASTILMLYINPMGVGVLLPFPGAHPLKGTSLNETEKLLGPSIDGAGKMLGPTSPIEPYKRFTVQAVDTNHVRYQIDVKFSDVLGFELYRVSGSDLRLPDLWRKPTY
jgi:hypothetical protein